MVAGCAGGFGRFLWRLSGNGWLVVWGVCVVAGWARMGVCSGCGVLLVAGWLVGLVTGFFRSWMVSWGFVF